MDDPDSNLFIYVVLLFVLVLINAFFAMSEIAVISLNDGKVRKAAAGGSKKARLLVKLIDKPSEFLATIQVGVTLSGFMASAIAADTFAAYIVASVTAAGWPVPPAAVRIVSLVLITFILSYVTLVLGELVPKRVAMRFYEKIAYAVAGPLNTIYKLEKPFVLLLSTSTNAVLRLFGIDPHEHPEEVTEEEIRMMIDVGEEAGNIEQSDKDMINNIFELDDREVGDMKRHRTEITAIEAGTSLSETVAVAMESGYSRIPVYEDDLDSISGILYVKDLLGLLETGAGREFDLARYMRPPLYVPESTSGKLLLKEFKEKKVQMAIVVDEYGGTSGLVTMEDLIESIVGSIQDEYDNEEEEISSIDGNRYMVDGLTPLEDVARYFDISIPDEDDFDTIGGYVINRLGYIPDDEEYPCVSVGDMLFTIRSMDERRVEKLEVERIPKQIDEETSA